MKVLIISYDDYANLAHNHANSLRSVDIYCKDIKLKKHPFNYEAESKVVDREELYRDVKDADIVLFYHSNVTVFNEIKDLNKNIISVHTGTIYRNSPKELNELFNPYCKAILTDQCEFMGLGGKNIEYIAAAINRIENSTRINHPFVFAHYPSSKEVKGTNIIQKHLRTLLQFKYPDRATYRISTERVDHKEQLERMQECDIYIELFAPSQNGNEYACYGVTAFEAAAFGKVVITQNNYPEVYEKAYGIKHPFITCKTEQELEKAISSLCEMTPNNVRILQEKNYQWIRDYHSYEATGKYLKTILEKYL